MTPQTVRAVLAYMMTGGLLACLLLVAFAKLDQAQATLVGTVLGAIVANGKVPLAYFFDGVASPDAGPPKAEPAAPVVPPADPPAAP